jgi:sigma-B regulation protein RsbU (phosphoserine phosphatase)
VSAVSVKLAPGDVLVFYTDGLTEAENRRGEPFGEDRLVDVVQGCAGQPAEKIKARLMAAVETFRDGAPPFDDLTLVVARYTGT